MDQWLEEDVVENNSLETVSQENVAYLASVLDLAGEAIIAMDEEHIVVLFNKAAETIFGYPAEEIVGRRVDLLIPPRFIESHRRGVERFAREEIEAQHMAKRSRVYGLRKDGSEFPAEASISKVHQNGRTTFITVMRDISTRQRIEAELVEAFQLLEERVGARTHELATLLEVSHSLAPTLELEPLLRLILDQLKTVVDYTSASVLTLEGGVLVVQEQRGPILKKVGIRQHFSVYSEIDQAIVFKRNPVIIADIRDDTPLARTFRETAGNRLEAYPYLRSWMGVPLVAREGVIGMLAFDHAAPDFYTQRHAELAMAFANQAALAIENARLFRAVRRSADQFRAISELGQRITSILDIDELLTQAVHLIQDTFGYYHVHIGLIEEDVIRLPAAAGVYEDEPTCSYCASLRLGLSQETVCGQVAATGEPLLVPDISQESRYLHPMGATGSGIVVPLKVKDRVIGLLDVENRQTDAFDESDVAVLQLLANQVAVAIANARLYEQAQSLAALQERQKLARELHDSVSQALYGISLGTRTALGMLDGSGLDETQATALQQPLEYTMSLAKAGLAEMRALIFELRPESLQMEGLVAALTRQVDAMSARHGIEVQTTFGLEPEIPVAAKETLYRVAQEALHNVVKHAGASRVEVSLHQHNGNVLLEIRDDGQGFDPQGHFPGHLGLQSMRERVEGSGGTLLVTSAPGEGTCIRACVPLVSTSDTD